MSNLESDPAETRCGGTVTLSQRADILPGRDVPLGRHTTVSRLVPHANRRMVGAWCFLDQFGPELIGEGPGMQVPPHPHCGLQTVSWLLDGEILHRDSLGTMAMIRPGQLNLMTAGNGIAHSEESPAGHSPALHGLQLWIALPAAVASAEPRFEHYQELPGFSDGGVHGTVVVGALGEQRSPARVHTEIVGVDLRMEPGTGIRLPLRTDFEYAVLAAAGTATVGAVGAAGSADSGGVATRPGSLLYLGTGRDSIAIDAPTGARLFLLGGEPFEEELVMWWNFVGRTHEEIVAAREDWAAGRRFGTVHGYDGDALPAPQMPTTRLKPRGREGHGTRG